MTPTHRSVARWVFVLGLAGWAFLAQIETAQAQFFDPFSYFFSPQPRYVRPVYSRRAPRVAYRRRAVLVWVPDRPRVRRSRGFARPRYVSLPRPARASTRHASVPPAMKETVRSEDKAKLLPRGPAEDPVAALMKDPTLRPGDIVVLPGGAKVFKGRAAAPYRPSDFDDASRSKLVGEKTRRQLTAMPIRPSASRAPVEAAMPMPGQEGGSQEVAVTGSVPRKVGP